MLERKQSSLRRLRLRPSDRQWERSQRLLHLEFVLLVQRVPLVRTPATVGPLLVKALIAHLQAQAKVPLLVSVDQEGGRVQRLRQGFVRLPAMRSIAEQPDAVQLAEHCGWLLATEVLAVGLDISFAPVLDLDHQRSAVVGGTARQHRVLARRE